MIETVNLAQHKELARVVRLADPSYRKRKVSLAIEPVARLSGTYWSGGSRYTYSAVNLATGQVSAAEQFAPAQFGGPSSTPEVLIPKGVAIVRTGWFCGEVSQAQVSIHPETAFDQPRLHASLA